jgi:hypothetical protein
MRAAAEELSDGARIILIVKAFVDCGQQVSRAAVVKQFNRETGRDPSEESMKKVMPKLKPVTLAPSSTVVVHGRKVLESDDKGKPLVVAQGPAPLWKNILGLSKSGLDGVVEIAKDLQSQIKALEEQLKEVKDEIQREMEGCQADRIRMDDDTTITIVKPIPYLGAPKREKLVEMGISGEIIDKACLMVQPKAYVKIAPPKSGE